MSDIDDTTNQNFEYTVKNSLAVSGFFKKLYFRKIVKVSNELFDVFKDRADKGKADWTDFFDVLHFHLVAEGFSFNKISRYFTIVKSNHEDLRKFIMYAQKTKF